jgi:hypothetical protein
MLPEFESSAALRSRKRDAEAAWVLMALALAALVAAALLLAWKLAFHQPHPVAVDFRQHDGHQVERRGRNSDGEPRSAQSLAHQPRASVSLARRDARVEVTQADEHSRRDAPADCPNLRAAAPRDLERLMHRQGVAARRIVVPEHASGPFASVRRVF